MSLSSDTPEALLYLVEVGRRGRRALEDIDLGSEECLFNRELRGPFDPVIAANREEVLSNV